MKKFVYPMEPEKSYHVFNRGIDGCKIFFSDDNYFYFLKLFGEKILPVAHLFSYCLLPNHFHFLVTIKPESEIRRNLEQKDQVEITSTISQQFSNFFNSYTQAVNKRYSRTGKSFELPFRRKLIESNHQMLQTIIYIHKNPHKHHLHDDIFEYGFSSVQDILSGNNHLIDGQSVIELFDDIDNFKQLHL